MTKIKSKKQSAAIAKWLRVCCLTGALVAYSASAFADVMANTALPQGGQSVTDNHKIDSSVLNALTVFQQGKNGVIKWDSFDIGSMGTVNFNGDTSGFNILNYVNSGGSMSQIHGTMNANNNGNIYLINPAGVFIGKSAQINVGSLYVGNQKIEALDKWKNGDAKIEVTDIATYINDNAAPATAAELMSLGHINADKVTFVGDRVVLDTDKLNAANGKDPMGAGNISVTGKDVVLGYTAYNETIDQKTGEKIGFAEQNSSSEQLAVVNGQAFNKDKGYMWIENLEQLQAMNTNLSGNYALHNGIDAAETNASLNDAGYYRFQAIGSAQNPFTGKFDGLANNIDGVDFSIFDLNIYANNGVNGTANLGLFGVTSGADIRNLTFVSGGVHIKGDTIDGGYATNVGMVAGLAKNSNISNITSSASITWDIKEDVENNDWGNPTKGYYFYHNDDGRVTSSTNIGGIVGSAEATTMSDLYNTGHVQGYMNVGGLVGSMTADANGNKSTLTGSSSNIGKVEGINLPDAVKRNSGDYLKDKNPEAFYSHNIGGLVGYAENAELKGTNGNVISNNLTVQGGYNVGGIVGSGSNVDIYNALNTGNITADGYIYEAYWYHRDSAGSTPYTATVANAGGIAGNISGVSTLDNVTNDGGDVVSPEVQLIMGTHNGAAYGATGEYLTRLAGNVGGIVGRAGSAVDNSGGFVDANAQITITNALNKENHVYGAHNIGGIAGYINNGSIDKAINNGGEILGTGAHDMQRRNGFESGYIVEIVRQDGSERYQIGNIGGIAGYMYGDETYISNSGNRGLVHTTDITVNDKVGQNNNLDPLNAKASNVGGIVGKIDHSDTASITELTSGTEKAAVSSSYNTGDVRGYSGVGGVVGMMYNGEVTDSYNEGTIRSSRSVLESDTSTVNMGGIVGDTTEDGIANALIYNVYNSGVIGDSTYGFIGRHIGGVVGRLSGTLEKAYNTGAIYNGHNVVGGVVGWWPKGSINNVFNTGNITVIYKPYNSSDAGSQVGGIVGTADVGYGGIRTLTNAYNLGTIRSFAAGNGKNVVGGILGMITHYGEVEKEPDNQKVSIKNVYTLGNIFAGALQNGGTYSSIGNDATKVLNQIGPILGGVNEGRDNPTDWSNVTIDNAYYIKPTTIKVAGQDYEPFNNLEGIAGAQNQQSTQGNTINIGVIEYANRFNDDQYKGFTFSEDNGSASGDVSEKTADGQTTAEWRIYDNGMPILNAFLPDAESYFSGNFDKFVDNNGNKIISSIQYGTAYNPLLTIINMKDNNDLVLNLAGKNNQDTNLYQMGKTDSFAVYGGGLTLNGFTISDGYYGGTIYSDGALNINSNGNSVHLGSASKLYGSSISINAGDGDVDLYGSITATGNADFVGKDNNLGDVNIQGGAIESLGTITSGGSNNESAYKDGVVHVPSVDNHADPGHTLSNSYENIADPSKAMPETGDLFAHDVTVARDADNHLIKGNINITATKGDVELLYGVNEAGKITSAGNLNVNADAGDIYMDADLNIGSSINLKADTTDGDIVLDISNVGKIGAADTKASVTALHNFLDHFKSKTGDNAANYNITMTGKDAMIALDMWDSTKGSFDLTKYDVDDSTSPTGKAHTLASDLNGLNLNVTVKDEDGKDKKLTARETSYIWISDAEQLKGIQSYYDAHKNDKDPTAILSYNFALKNNIDANSLTGYTSIGSMEYVDANGVVQKDGKAFTGTFNGRGNYIIGLNVDTRGTAQTNYNDYVGVFGVNEGTIKNMSVISSNFTGSSVGAIAGLNRGTISNIDTFGNRVESYGTVVNTALGTNGQFGMAGGIAGLNRGTITDVNVQDTIVAGTAVENNNTIHSTAGGVVGYNVGTIQGSIANSDVVSSSGDAEGLGGIVGVNNTISIGNKPYTGSLESMESMGIINGTYHTYTTEHDGTVTVTTHGSNNVGGIAGVNYNGAEINNAYNEAIVSGKNAVGGIVGFAGSYGTGTNGSSITNVVNAEAVTGSGQNTGGIVGKNGAENSAIAGGTVLGAQIDGGRNTGAISGVINVGGIAGYNYNTQDKTSLNNLINDGSATITGVVNVGGVAGYNEGIIDATNEGLVNNGEIHGWQNVGGIAGTNTGTIVNTVTNMDLYVVDSNYVDNAVAEYNANKDKTDPAVNIDTAKDNPQYFGGVAGHNTAKGTITDATNSGKITAEKATYVGGIAGLNEGMLSSKPGQNVGNTNTGVVIGENYVGGVAGENRFNYNDTTGSADNLYKMNNSGTVIALDGGAGGIFGVNEGTLQYVELTNSGAVIGTTTAGTGGVIGINNAAAVNSSLKNELGGKVIGAGNVGGLIGVNNSSVTGGRDESDNYYKYQIYNNGQVIGGTAEINKDKDGNVTSWDADKVTDIDKSTSVGGLIGSNDSSPSGGLIGPNVGGGSLTAGYNTGSVTGGTNVGGIAGSNSGSIDQVFSTTDVALVGSGVDTGITNAYNTNADGTQNIINQKDKDDKNIWKVYTTDPKSNELLSVFLTNAKVEFKDADGNAISNFAYDGKTHKFVLGNVVTGENGKNYVLFYYADQDGTNQQLAGRISVVDDKAVHSLQDYIDTLNKGNGNLIQGIDGVKDAGTYNDFLYSLQINTGDTSNPNNLGFNFVTEFATKPGDNTPPPVFELDKKQLTISLEEIFRKYGSLDAYKGSYDKYIVDGLVDADKDLEQYIKMQFTQDGALTGASQGRVTENVGKYQWSADVKFTDTDAMKNYTLGDKGSNVTNAVVSANSYVEKVDLHINVGDIEINLDDRLDSKYNGSINEGEIVNGDSIGSLQIGNWGITDSGLVQKPGTHKDVLGIWIGNQFYSFNNTADNADQGVFTNYNLILDPGTLTVLNENVPTFWEAEDKYAWGKKREERERKAEVRFVDGGMEL